MSVSNRHDIVGNIEIILSNEVQRQVVDDILACALDGAITYWCVEALPSAFPDDAEYASDCLSRGASINFYDGQDVDRNGQPKCHTVDLKKFLYGIERYCARRRMSVAEMYEDHDADTADEIVQYAAFGEIVYG